MNAISFDRVSKAYDLQAGRRTLFATLMVASGAMPQEGLFHALTDVSFDIQRGEAIGIIGSNGSGKSTILKLIAGITAPTSGAVRISGRVASLIELGAGFHPEFTGRENIYLNAATFGIPRSVIDKKFEEIVDFAELGTFIDVPLKKYSSGMQARLGFSTAVNVNPDILLIDEALGVGDLKFQMKSRERMNDFKKRNVTIVLVSHNMSDISVICDRAIFLESGRTAFIGGVSDAINAYTFEENQAESRKVDQKSIEHRDDWGLPTEYGGDMGGTRDIVITKVLCYEKGRDKQTHDISFGENIIIEFDYEAARRVERPIFRVNFSVTGYRFFANIDSVDAGLKIPFVEGRGKIVLEVKRPNLYPQAYKVNLAVTTEELNTHLFFWNEAASFVVRAPNGKCMSYPTAIIELQSEATHIRD
ncbi:MAG TPA: ABC transporter ATP-binding protein [Bacteroidota bacterium]|jgi:ABC-2 type transport system ATP-binding protein/lipopolysaccharide transport system ATP-binding protein